MAFATAWLKTGTVFPAIISEAPHPETGIIVVIPAFDEPGLSSTLDSLVACEKPSCAVEVIVNINAPGNASELSLANNSLTINEIMKWRERNSSCFFHLCFFDCGQPEIKKWGVGLARKSLMEEALRRFDQIEQPDGIIVNLDADCKVDSNYFLALEKDFLLSKDKKACSVYFEHPVEGEEYPNEVYEAIIQYELHLRYYRHALSYTGFPYSYHTVGSSLAIRAKHYMLAGGMNRRQAGEDFYFIQKLLPSGGFFSLASTVVHPSPRPSERVPFGTGTVIAKMTGKAENKYLTYNTQAFGHLKAFFSVIDLTYSSDIDINRKIYKELPDTIRDFIPDHEWSTRISEIKNNTSTIQSYRKRFFGWFNMFRIVKYLNHSHKSAFSKVPVGQAVKELLAMTGNSRIPNKPLELLNLLRKADREISPSLS